MEDTGKIANYKPILVAILLGALMTALDATIVSVALPTIANDILASGHKTDMISWVLLSYTLMLCCFILLWSKIGTNTSYKLVFSSGIAIFTTSSVLIGLCGVFPQIGLGPIILLRAVQGIGAGMVMAVNFAMVSAYLPAETRGYGLGLVTLAASVGTAVGPALGGILTSFHWSLIFFVNLPIGLIALVFCRKIPGIAIQGEKRRLDVVGAALMLAMMFSMVYYLNQGSEFGWTSVTGIILICVMFASGGLLAYWEQRVSDPLIKIKMVVHRQIFGASMVALLVSMALAGSYLLLPYYLKFMMGYDTLGTGLILIASSAGIMAAGPLAGKYSDRTGNNKILMVAGSVISAVSFLMLTSLGDTAQLWFIIVALFVMGAGVALTFSGSTNHCYGYIEKGEDGLLSGLINTFRQAGNSAGVAVLNAVFMAGILAIIPGITTQEALVPGFHHAFFVAFIICLAAFIIAMALRDSTMRAE